MGQGWWQGVLAGVLVAGAGMAEGRPSAPAVIYDCHVDNAETFIPHRLFLKETSATQEVLVWDGYVKETAGKPIPARVEEDTADDLRLAWTVRGIEGTDNHNNRIATDVDYAAVYVRGGQLTITAQVRSFGNPLYQSSGTCTDK